MARIEAVRVTQDPSYAASLSDADWLELAHDPTWQEMVGEQPEMVRSVLDKYGDRMPYEMRWDGTTNTKEQQVPPIPLKVIGTDIARIQGLGIVTNLGQYTEHMKMSGMLFMRTLRSRYPHA